MANLLDRVRLDRKLSEKKYAQLLEENQVRLRALAQRVHEEGLSCVFAFEGWDAAGKGGAIRRLTQPLDPRVYEVHAIAAPEGEDKVRHYLYRFWRRLPDAGQICVFDRTWYGRVLVERVEGFAKEYEWKRAYREIDEFEGQLVDAGIILGKFWLHISKAEQLRRFEARRNDHLRSWKLTEEDWRNREKWPVYEAAVREMIEKTSTKRAPWTIVEANDKYWARIRVVSTCVEMMEKALDSKRGKRKKRKNGN